MMKMYLASLPFTRGRHWGWSKSEGSVGRYGDLWALLFERTVCEKFRYF